MLTTIKITDYVHNFKGVYDNVPLRRISITECGRLINTTYDLYVREMDYAECMYDYKQAQLLNLKISASAFTTLGKHPSLPIHTTHLLIHSKAYYAIYMHYYHDLPDKLKLIFE